MTRALTRPLSGLRVGISISGSEDSDGRGFPAWQVNRVTMQFAAALLGQGAGMVFGHDWRDDGVMEAVHDFAMRMQAPVARNKQEGPVPAPLLQNLLPWPDTPKLAPGEIKRLAATLSIKRAGLPDDVAGLVVGRSGKDVKAYLRARALTHLRNQLVAQTGARICIGGRTRGSRGRYPGVIEEAYLSVQTGRPLFLIGLLGGATRQLIDAVDGKPRPSGFGKTGDIDRIYGLFDKPGRPEGDVEISPDRVWSRFVSLGVAGLVEQNGLNDRENIELHRTPSVERAIELVLMGLAKIPKLSRT